MVPEPPDRMRRSSEIGRPTAGSPPIQVVMAAAAPRAVLPTQSFGAMAPLRGVASARGSSRVRRIRRMLANPASRHDAIILVELIGPPRALVPH